MPRPERLTQVALTWSLSSAGVDGEELEPTRKPMELVHSSLRERVARPAGQSLGDR